MNFCSLGSVWSKKQHKITFSFLGSSSSKVGVFMEGFEGHTEMMGPAREWAMV